MRPCVCVSLGHCGLVDPASIRVRSDWLEIRYDLLEPGSLDDRQALLRWTLACREAFPRLILTYRRPCAEGCQERLDFLAQVCEEYGFYVDQDIDEPTEHRNALAYLARQTGTRLILSKHFRDHVSVDEVRRLLDSMQAQRPWLSKVVVPARSYIDTFHLLDLYAHYENVLLLSAGPYGAYSREVAPLLGAPFTYGYHLRPTAPCQPRAEDLQKIYDAAYGS